MLTNLEWHARFTQQARWTQDLRRYLFERFKIETAQRVLEVGCGTGAILGDLSAGETTGPVCSGKIKTYGVDTSLDSLILATRISSNSLLTQGDAHTLPYPDGCFDFAICHFVLLWVDDPLQVLREMRRVTRPGGAVVALAEPDYGGRIDYPEELAVLGEWQRKSLESQGADPLMGRKLAGLFHRVGLDSVETGALGGQWTATLDWEAWESEWAVLESDIKEKPSFSEKLGFLKALDKSAYEKGERVLFVPTFYAVGVAPKSDL